MSRGSNQQPQDCRTSTLITASRPLLFVSELKAIEVKLFYLFIYFNEFFRFLIFQLNKPFMPGDPSLGHLPTVQAQIRRRKTRRLIRVYTVCYRNFHSKYNKKWKSTPFTPKSGNRLVQLIRMYKSTMRQRVKRKGTCIEVGLQVKCYFAYFASILGSRRESTYKSDFCFA